MAAAELPAWSLDRDAALANILRSPFPLQDPRAWAWEGSTGAGVRACVVDSGVGHLAAARGDGTVIW